MSKHDHGEFMTGMSVDVCEPGAGGELRVAVGVWKDLGKWELPGRRVYRSEALLYSVSFILVQ